MFPSVPITKPSPKVQEVLCATLLDLLKSPDLTPEDLKWVRQFAMRLLAELTALKAAGAEGRAA